MGNDLRNGNVDTVVKDETNKIYSNPSYMKGDATPHEIQIGISNLVSEIAKDLGK